VIVFAELEMRAGKQSWSVSRYYLESTRAKRKIKTD
jgi:hypothetical protein